MPVHHHRDTCRICGSHQLEKFLELGPQPLANSLLISPDEFSEEKFYPLDLYFCHECTLVQLLDVIDPSLLFRHYLYLTGMSSTIAAHNNSYAKDVVDLLALKPGELVVEFASNDGSLLSCFKPFGVRTLGVEPATNIAAQASDRGIETVNEFFTEDVAKQLRFVHGPARAVVGNNVLAHVDDTLGILSACREMLSDDGLIVIEVPYLGPFLDRLEYDTVYHEHLCYFSVTALVRAVESVGLRMVRIDQQTVHGGSLRIYAGHQKLHPFHAASVMKMIEEERQAGFHSIERYRKFAHAVQANRTEVRSLLEDLKLKGKTVAAYGAPAKGNTLLNYCGIGPELIPFTVDKSPLKVGRFCPGSHIPILSVSTLLERQPNYVLILPWNIAEEIFVQENEYKRRGGNFIIPIPRPRVI